jgi:hypothetical protein
VILCSLQCDFFKGGSFPIADAESTIPVVNKLREKSFDIVAMCTLDHSINHNSFASNHPVRASECVARSRCVALPALAWTCAPDGSSSLEVLLMRSSSCRSVRCIAHACPRSQHWLCVWRMQGTDFFSTVPLPGVGPQTMWPDFCVEVRTTLLRAVHCVVSVWVWLVCVGVCLCVGRWIPYPAQSLSPRLRGGCIDRAPVVQTSTLTSFSARRMCACPSD